MIESTGATAAETPTTDTAHHGSKRAVVFAILGNGTITVAKFFAAVLSGSASMMNETVHSLMDTINQLFLFLGLHQAERPADKTHAFGHGQKKYLWNLWSAIGLFSIGAGLGLAHAWHASHNLDEVKVVENIQFGSMSFHPVWISAIVLLFAFVVEAFVLKVACKEYFARMREDGATNPVRYIFQCDDPTLTAVVLEDSVAVLGLVLAATGIGLSLWLANPVWDIVFSVMIALVLGVVAVLLGAINMKYLTAVRDTEAEDVFRDVVSNHPQIERFHDLRSLIVDDHNTILVGEVELREEALLSGLAQRITTHERRLVSEASGATDTDRLTDYVRTRAAVEETLLRTEEIVDEIEAAVRERCPQVSHITIEVQGIADEPDTKGAVTG